MPLEIGSRSVLQRVVHSAPMTPLLEDLCAVVSGAGPGLGRRIALAMAREGAAVVLGARTESYLAEVAAEIEAAGGRVASSPTDISDREQCRRLVDTAVEQFGRLDVLVNSAYRPDVFRPFEDVDLDAWRKIFDVNVFGTLQLTQSAVPHLKAAGRGAIVFVSSMVVRKIVLNQGGYAASKGALLTAAQVLASELGQYGIRVNSVMPGWMWGPPVQGYVKATAKATGASPESVYDGIAADIPLGAIPTDGEVAEAVVFLASDRAGVITGQCLNVNGGEVFT